MATTPLGIPKFALTDNADVAAKLNAIADTVDGLLQARLVTCIRGVAGATPRGITTGVQFPIPGWDATTASVGDLAYSGGVFTVATPGRYNWSLTAQWHDPGAATYQRSQYLHVNGVSVQSGRIDFEVVPNSFTGSAQFLTAGGPVDLRAGDAVQPMLFTTGADQAVAPLAFTLWRIG